MHSLERRWAPAVVVLMVEQWLERLEDPALSTLLVVCFPWLQLGSSLTLNTPCRSPEEMAAEWTFMNGGERAYHLTLIKRDHGVSQ